MRASALMVRCFPQAQEHHLVIAFPAVAEVVIRCVHAWSSLVAGVVLQPQVEGHARRGGEGAML